MLIETAEKYLGFTARPGHVTPFGGAVGYQGLPWAGSFIDYVAREAGVVIPACVYPPSGLAEFMRLDRWRARPQPGDIVFYAFPTEDQFGIPHVGIVTDVRDWQRRGRFQAIEAQTDSGLAKGPVSKDGVYRRVRWRHEVIGFGRPAKAGKVHSLTGKPEVRLVHMKNKRHASIELVQLALAARLGTQHFEQPGVYDGHTKAAYAQYQRAIGYVGLDANGLPDINSLQRLGRDSGYFTAGD